MVCRRGPNKQTQYMRRFTYFETSEILIRKKIISLLHMLAIGIRAKLPTTYLSLFSQATILPQCTVKSHIAKTG